MPRQDFDFKKIGSGAFIRLRRKLERPEALLRQLGAIILGDAQKAFKEQRLGNVRWPARYPSQEQPKVNIAGIVADFLQGRRNPPKRRFQDRPTLKDSGNLRNSLSSAGKAVSVNALTVVVGTTLLYAPQHQWGGESRQKITKGVRSLLAAFLRKKANRKYRGRLGFLFQRNELRTKINPRPFLGITPDAESKMVALLVGRLSDASPGGATS